MNRYLYILLILFLPFAVNAQVKDSLPEPDRSAEDFVIVSLCIADPTTVKDDALGVLGHAFLRLQCPYYNLDFCFSYEGERVNDNPLRYLSGKTKMGMFAVPTQEYIQDYYRWNRSVHEYFIDLPPETETRLWEIMDNHLTQGITLTQDLNKYGCAITVVRYVKQALGNIKIQYEPSELDDLTRREIGYRSLDNHPWLRLFNMILTDSRYDRDCPIDEKLIVPADLAKVWENATVDGRKLATYKTDIVSGEPINNEKPWFTPILAAILLLIITLALSFTNYKFWDYTLLSLQTITGLILIALWFMVKDYSMSAYILLAIMNPLPLICWRWRKYWGMAYAAILLVLVITLLCLPHMIIDPSILILTLSYIVIYTKDFVKQLINNVRAK